MAEHQHDTGSALKLKAKLRRMSGDQLGELKRAITDRGLGLPEPTTESSPDQTQTRD